MRGEKKHDSQRGFLAQRLCLKTCNKCMLLNKDMVQVPTRLLGLDTLQYVLEPAYLQMDVGWQGVMFENRPLLRSHPRNRLSSAFCAGSSLHCSVSSFTFPSPAWGKEPGGRGPAKWLRGAGNALSCYSIWGIPCRGQELWNCSTFLSVHQPTDLRMKGE